MIEALCGANGGERTVTVAELLVDLQKDENGDEEEENVGAAQPIGAGIEILNEKAHDGRRAHGSVRRVQRRKRRRGLRGAAEPLRGCAAPGY